MTSITNSLSLLRFTSQLGSALAPPSSLRSPSHSVEDGLNRSIALVFRFDSCRLRWTLGRSSWRFCVRASNDSLDSGGGNGAGTLRGMVDAFRPTIFVVRKNIGSKVAVVMYIAFGLFVIVVRQVMLKKQSHKHQGSVADLVRRGQLRSDRRGISKPLKSEDPFNNPLVKVGKSDSTIEMCGKVYRLAPVTLTEEQQSEHQKRRSRAYQWKSTKVFLKEGDSIPANVDPDAVRWLPSNHPFATTVSDIDEKMAQDNVSQKHGVPSRIKEEHEALQEKLEALQSGGDFHEVTINLRSIQGSEGAIGSSCKPHEEIEPRSSTDQQYDHITSNPNPEVGFNGNVLPDETKREF